MEPGASLLAARKSSLRRVPPMEPLPETPKTESFVAVGRVAEAKARADLLASSNAEPPRRARRDSIVFEKARQWGAAPSQAETTRLTLTDLSEFPMPPRPALPGNGKTGAYF